MNYHDIKKCDMLNGDGIRVSLWVSGCEHHCHQCQNPQTWSADSGVLFDKKAKDELFEALKNDYISGITFTGGDPLYKDNLKTVQNLIDEIRRLFPDKDIWLYTGYCLSECQQDAERNAIVSKCDVVIDGEYIDELRDVTAHWRGSSNQRIWGNCYGKWVDITDEI